MVSTFTWYTSHGVDNGIAQRERIDDFLGFVRVDDSDHGFVIGLGSDPDDRRELKALLVDHLIVGFNQLLIQLIHGSIDVCGGFVDRRW